ncbi:MAG: ABC transporter ATP-binding protein [Lachnospiraceae bacterium]|nr:ABC transporter ATP-binding protein [Lachnospiraceae bacterium]
MILEVDILSYRYQKAVSPILRDVSFQLDSGEIMTILGCNGAGKSTLLNCLGNVFTPTSGRILLGGEDLRAMNLRKAARMIGYVPQNHTAVYSYTVRDFIVMGRAPHLGILQSPGEKDYEIADQVIKELGIVRLADKAYTEISGGERQQALIGRAIVQQPKIILFDEPTNHLDYGNQLRMLRMVRKLAKKGYAVLMTTHMPEHAMLLGGKTAILDRKGMLHVGNAEEVINEKAMDEIYQIKVKIVYVPEVGRKICVFDENMDADKEK